MTRALPPREVLATVTLDGLSAYLRGHGWTSSTRRGTLVWTQALPEGEVEVEVPTGADDRRYVQTIAEALYNLSAVEGRDVVDIVQDLRAQDRDRMSVRLSGADVDAGRLAVEAAAAVVRGIRDVLLAAACAAVQPRAAYHARKPDEAMSVLRRLCIAPFEEGSFVVQVEARVAPRLQEPLPGTPWDEPMERRTGLVLANALAALRSGVVRARIEGSGATLLASVPQGVSANLCDAVGDLLDGSGAERIDVRWSWAGIRPVVGPEPGPVTLDRSQTGMIREAAMVLRARDPRVEFELEGFVVRLESNDAPQGGTAIVHGAVDERSARVTVALGPTEYATAIEAHERRQPVTCTGSLRRDGRSYRLDNAAGFRVLPELPETG